MKPKDPNKKHYFSPVPKEEVSSAMSKMVEEKSIVRIWFQGKSEKEVEEFDCVKFDDSSFTLFLKMKGGLLSKFSSSKLIDKDIFVKVGEGKFQYFTTSILRQNKEDKTYYVKLSRDVYKTQQRSNYRLMANSFNKIQLKIDDDRVLDGLDISAGGTSFLIPEDDLEAFPKEHYFNDCTLKFNRLSFKIPKVRVAGHWENKDSLGEYTGQYKVGVAFEGLTSETEEALFKHINGEARAEEMRKKLQEMKK